MAVPNLGWVVPFAPSSMTRTMPPNLVVCVQMVCTNKQPEMEGKTMGKFYSTGVVHQFRCADDYGSQFILQRPSDNADIQCVYRDRVDCVYRDRVDEQLMFLRDGESVMVCGDLDDSGHCIVDSVEIVDTAQFPSQDE